MSWTVEYEYKSEDLRDITSVVIRDPDRNEYVATVARQHAWLAAAPELYAELEKVTRQFHACLLESGTDPEFAEIALVSARNALARVRTIQAELDAQG